MGEGGGKVTLPQLKHVMSIDWRSEARCAKLPKEVFFNYSTSGMKKTQIESRTKAAKAVCRACPVKEQCYEFAVLNNEPYGIWAGTLPEQRRQLYRRFTQTGILEKMPTF